MLGRGRLAYGAMVLIAVVTVAIACDDDDSEGTTSTAIAVRIVRPTEGAEVRSPVVLEIQAVGKVTIEGTVEGGPDSFHYAAFVDQDGALRGASVVRDGEAQGVYQFTGSFHALHLSPGRHTIVVGLADAEDVMSAVPPASVTLTVTN